MELMKKSIFERPGSITLAFAGCYSEPDYEPKATEKEVVSIFATAICKFWRVASHVVYLKCVAKSDDIGTKLADHLTAVARPRRISL